MSHRKVSSQGSLPFSWEDSPGVSKVIDQDYLLDHGISQIGVVPSSPPSPKSLPHSLESSSKDIRIPLPPCPSLQPPQRSTSLKGLRWWQDDPFFVAYMECTKNEKKRAKVSVESKKSVGTRVRKTKLIFSCRNSCDVKENNLVRLSKNLPSIPTNRVRGRYVDNCRHSLF